MELIEKSTELTVQERASVALAADKTRQDLMEMAAKYTAITEIKNKAGRDECHSAAMTLASARIAISKTGKAARDDATKFSKAVIAEEASLIAITEPEEKRLLALRDSWDAAVAAEKAAREAAERSRIMAITDRIAGIRQYIELAASCRTAARIYELQEKLVRISMDGFEEFSDEAAAAHADAMKRVEAMLVEKHLQEQEQEKVKAEQAEQAAQAAALKAEREAFAAQQAAAQAMAEAQRAALAAERAEFEAQQAAAKQAAEQAEAARIESLREIETPPEPKTVTVTPVEQSMFVHEAPACCAPDGICTDACSKEDARDEAAMWVAITNAEPSDADVMWTCIKACSVEYRWTTEQATARLQAIDWTI